MSTPRQARCCSCCKGGRLVAPVSADEADEQPQRGTVLHVRFWPRLRRGDRLGSPLVGEDRKSLTDGQTDAIDPDRTCNLAADARISRRAW